MPRPVCVALPPPLSFQLPGDSTQGRCARVQGVPMGTSAVGALGGTWGGGRSWEGARRCPLGKRAVSLRAGRRCGLIICGCAVEGSVIVWTPRVCWARCGLGCDNASGGGAATPSGLEWQVGWFVEDPGCQQANPDLAKTEEGHHGGRDRDVGRLRVRPQRDLRPAAHAPGVSRPASSKAARRPGDRKSVV